MKVELYRLKEARAILSAKRYAVQDGILQESLDLAIEIMDDLVRVTEHGGTSLINVIKEVNNEE